MSTQATASRSKFIAWPTGQQDVVRARIAAHKAADEIAQGVGYRVAHDYEGGTVRACAIGCSLDRYDHQEYSAVLGVDLRIARLVDRIHESLPFALAVKWPGRVAAALTPGADTSLVADRFTVWMLRQGVCARNASCAAVATLYDERLQGREPSREQWVKVQRDAAAYAAAAAAAAARKAFWKDAADVLVELLSRCRVPA